MKNALIASIFVILGFTLLSFTLYPFFVWYFFYVPKIESQKLISPLANYLGDGAEYPGRVTKSSTSEFFLSIPRLEIDKAQVKVDSTDFISSLAHYPQSALPGEEGNVFVTGHSILPQFYNPKNYTSIFSRLYTLEQGDDIIISTSDISQLRYTVIGMVIVKPQDLWVLKTPDKEGKYLSLLTCTPPGLTQGRLVVLAKQV